MVEWIQHPLLMLEVQGSNPAPSKKTTSLLRRLPEKTGALTDVGIEWSEGGGVKNTKKHNLKICQLDLLFWFFRTKANEEVFKLGIYIRNVFSRMFGRHWLYKSSQEICVNYNPINSGVISISKVEISPMTYSKEMSSKHINFLKVPTLLHFTLTHLIYLIIV